MIPQPFTTTSPKLVNYDWTELSTGIGYATFYCAASTNSAGITYFLTTKVLEGYPIIDSINGADAVDRDFDYEFKEPMVVKGDALFNFTQYGGTASTGVMVITVYHVSAAAAETSIGTVTSATRAGTDATPWRHPRPWCSAPRGVF